MYDPESPTPDLPHVSLGEFHAVHNEAEKAQKIVREGVARMSVQALNDALATLQAGQDLSDEEFGNLISAEDVPLYLKEIRLIEDELKSRSR